MPVLLTDLDDAVFPFSHVYRRWLRVRHGRDIPQWAWDAYEINETGVPGHQALMEEFFSDPWVLEHGAPVPDAARALGVLARKYDIVACTARYEHTEAHGTRAWMDRHLPWLADVVFTNWHPELPRSSAKGEVARSVGAVALIDDRREHLDTVVPPTRALLVERPAGVPSEPGALSWAQILDELA